MNFSTKPLLLRYRRHHSSAAELRLRDDFVILGDHAEEFIHLLPGAVFVEPFLSTQAEHDFHAMSLFKEFLELAELDEEIVLRGAGADLHLFHAHDFLRPPGLFSVFSW